MTKQSVFLLCLICTMSVSAQHIVGGTMDKKTKLMFHSMIEAQYDSNSQTDPPKGRVNSISDSKEYAFYLDITKRNGWPEGVGKPLKKSDLGHIPVYYKLSNKNQAGKWTVLRAYNAYGQLTTNNTMTTYIVDPHKDNDEYANRDWVEKLKTICQWVFIGDNDGKEVIQERGLDADNRIIYCYNSVKISEDTYVGSYTDGWGMPAYMRTDSLGDYHGQANFVQIKRDQRGYDVLFTFTDEKGFSQKNKDGAYMIHRRYDDKGNQRYTKSFNMVGDPICIDNGYCSWRDSADEYGCIVQETYFDKNDQPVRRLGISGHNHVFGYELKYDPYHRETDRWFLDSVGNRTTNEYGVFHLVMEYNEHGERTAYHYYDRNDRLVAGEAYGIAEVFYAYNDYGNLVKVEWHNAKQQLINGYGNFCKQIREYDSLQNIIHQEEYIIDDDGKEIISFLYYRDPQGNEKRIWRDNGYYYSVDSVDNLHRPILEAWYNMNGNPIARTYAEPKWHKHTTSYNDSLNTKIETWLDTDSTPYWGYDATYNQYVTITDTTRHLISINKHISQFGPIECYQYQYDSLFNSVAQWDLTPYGEHARVGWFNNLHYTCQVERTMYNKLRSWKGVNEFGEPSYITTLYDNENVHYFYNMNSYYDEWGNVIPPDSMPKFRASLPKAFCIEVTDTAIAYPLGLKNGDIILSYGNWATAEDLNSNLDYFYLETIMQRNKSKNILVLRHDIASRTSTIISLTLPKGKPSDLGFYPHQICYTQREKQRLLDACHNYGFHFGSDTNFPKDKQVLMAVQLKGGVYETIFYHYPVYDFKDPGFLLYAKQTANDKDQEWRFETNDVNDWYDQDMYNSRFDGITNLIVTQDCFFTHELRKTTVGNKGLRIIPIWISNQVYHDLLFCYTNTILPDPATTQDTDKETTQKKNAKARKR